MSSSSSSDTCSSRHFSWLMKSCFPNPNHHHPFTAINTAAATTIASLPDDLLLECLTRVHQSSLTHIPLVCRRWAHLLNSPSFHILRCRNHLLFNTLFSISISSSALYTATLRLDHDADRLSWKVSSFVLSIGSAFSLFSHFRLVSIGRKIYVIGRTAMLRCDTWTGTLVPKQGMGLQRKKFAAAVVAGKIYVAGGSTSSAVEEYDPELNEWRVVCDAPRRRYGCIGASADGVFYVIGGLKLGEVPLGAASSMDLYDVAARGWMRSRSVPGGGCVVAACAANGHVYVLSSHAVELSFWRFNGVRKSKRFGEWCRVRTPPVPAQVRVDGTVRFSCVGVGEKVVLIQVAGLEEGLVLVYDCATGEWCRVADLPEVIRRAVCVSVEC